MLVCIVFTNSPLGLTSVVYRATVEDRLADLPKLLFVNCTFAPRPKRFSCTFCRISRELELLKLPSIFAVKEYLLAGFRYNSTSTVSPGSLGICSTFTTRHAPKLLKRLIVFTNFLSL